LEETELASRRNFLTGAASMAGIIFCGCGSPRAAHASSTSPYTLPVTVGGKTVKTVDVHSHCLFHETLDLVPGDAAGLVPPINGNGPHEIFMTVEDRTKAMDASAVDMEIISVNPFWYGKDRDLAAKIVSINNEKLAELVASKPDRFGAFASLTLQDPALAVTELETANKKQGLKGAAIGDQVAGSEFADPKFDPVWQKAEELGAVLFIHPQGVPELSKRLQGNGWQWNTIANPLATTIALNHLIFQGTLDKFPGLRVLGAHGGGYLGSYAPRDDHACLVGPAYCDPNIKLKKQPTEYLNQLYFDALVFTPEALRHLVAQVGASQIMMGSDHPYPWDQHPVENIMATTTLTDDEKRGILGENAARLFGLKS
jgi:aminocarboxymuconate-semialdehyde decarboxylase